jgi:ribulose-5-phosphate 4-epimerase/fuculose-1-phosphate aldolase
MKKSGLFEETSDITISLRYGKRVLINGKNSLFGELKQEDFLEIVDYDPMKKIILLIGPNEPKFDSTIHWLVHYAKKEINAVVQINSKRLVERIKNRLPETEVNYQRGSLELAKEILKAIRNSKGLIIKKNGVFFVGKDIDEIKKEILKE